MGGCCAGQYNLENYFLLSLCCVVSCFYCTFALSFHPLMIECYVRSKESVGIVER